MFEDDEDDPKKVQTKEEIQKEKERRKQRRLVIRAIEFDWIFNKVEGVSFLKTLAETEYIEIFSYKLIQNIIRFMWSYYKIHIVTWVLIPFLFYLSIFCLYTTWIHKKKQDNNEGYFEGYGLANTFMIVVILMFNTYFAYYEIRQILFHKLTYFMSLWNLIDLSSLLLNTTIVICDLAGVNEPDLNTMMSWAILFIWLKLFYFGRIFESTAATIRMVIDISYDMSDFLLIFMLCVAGFGNCFMILARNYGTDGMFTGQTIWRSFIYSYNQAMGNFDTDAYVDDDKYYLFFIWFLNTMITLIIFLNLLIAIMGDTFDRVQETVENNTLNEFAQIMVENEIIFPRSTIFKDAK
jgi:hypothetical protein